MYQSHLKSNTNRVITIGEIRERQIKEGSFWSKSYENIHSNIGYHPLPTSSSSLTSLPIKPSINLPDQSAIIIALQLEVERLKAKVNTVIKTSEETINEFTLQHEDVKNQYINQYETLLDNYNDILADRDLRQNVQYMNHSTTTSPMKSSPLKDVKERDTTDVDNALRVIENMNKEKLELELKNNDVMEKNKELNEKLIKLQNVAIHTNKLKQENDELNLQLKEISANYEESHKICMKLEQELLSLSFVEKELRELKHEHDQLSEKSQILEENVNELRNENTDYRNKIEKLMKLEEININISNKSSALTEKMSLLVDQYEAEKNKCKYLESEVTKMKYDNQVLSNLLSAMEERNGNLDKQLENSSNCFIDLKKEKNLQGNEISTLREQCKVLETKNKNANNRVETLESSIKELSDEFRALTEKDCNKFHSTLKEYESRLDIAAVEKDTLISTINKLNKEKEEAIALQSALSQLTEEMELKINQIEHDKRILSDTNAKTCALNDELQQTTTDFLTVATSTIKELEEKLYLVELEKERLLNIINTEHNHNEISISDNDNEKDPAKYDDNNNHNSNNDNDAYDVKDNSYEIDTKDKADIDSNDNNNDNDSCIINQEILEVQKIDTTIPFNATKIESSNGFSYIQCITAMDTYTTFSQEELRFAGLSKNHN